MTEGFNEAAADDRGKLYHLQHEPTYSHWASMRPRPMTAENFPARQWGTTGQRSFNEAAADDRGKPSYPACNPSYLHRASMRPRPMTAENDALNGPHRGAGVASMRPRPMTAENPPRRGG